MARVLVYPSLNSPEAVDGTCDQQRLIRLRRCAGRSVFPGRTIVGFVMCWLKLSVLQRNRTDFHLVYTLFVNEQQICFLAIRVTNPTNISCYNQMGHVKRKSAFKHEQIQIILCMHKVSSRAQLFKANDIVS